MRQFILLGILGVAASCSWLNPKTAYPQMGDYGESCSEVLDIGTDMHEDSQQSYCVNLTARLIAEKQCDVRGDTLFQTIKKVKAELRYIVKAANDVRKEVNTQRDAFIEKYGDDWQSQLSREEDLIFDKYIVQQIKYSSFLLSSPNDTVPVMLKRIYHCKGDETWQKFYGQL